MNRWARRGLIAVAALVGVIVVGNVLIVGSYFVAARTVDVTTVPEVDGVGNLAVVDDKVWRGANPTRDGMRSIAEAGVATVVDLRPNGQRDDDYVRSLGMRPVNIYVPDGQTPRDEDVDRFLRVVRESDGTVFVHCSSGVGRSGVDVGRVPGAHGRRQRSEHGVDEPRDRPVVVRADLVRRPRRRQPSQPGGRGAQPVPRRPPSAAEPILTG